MRVLNLVTTERPFFRQQVRALERKGVTCTTVSVPGIQNSRSVSHYLRFYPRALLEAVQGYDIVHANYGLTAPAALAQPNRPVVLSLWGTDIYGPYGWLSRRCASYVDEVIVMSSGLAQEISRDCHIIPHCVDLDLFEPRSVSDARRELDWSADSYHVLFPYATDREEKNYPRAEAVVERTRDRVERPVRMHAITGVPHGEMPTYMNASDVLLLTSKHEGSPNAVKEAMACNLPVVSTDVGDVRDLLEGVSPSAVCRTDDEIVDRLSDIFQKRERSNGRKQIKPYNLEHLGSQLVEIYDDLVR